MTKLNKWQIYCIDENEWSEGWLEDGIIPEKCFNDGNHNVNLNSAIIIDTIEETTMTIKEESIPTGGHFCSRSILIECSSGINKHRVSFPTPISALSITFKTKDIHEGDLLNMSIGNDIIYGYLTADVNINDKVINVSQSVINNAKIGFFISIDGKELGQVINIDKMNLQLSLDKPCTDMFFSNKTINLYPKVINDFIIGFPGLYEIGKEKIGGSHVPSNTNIELQYENKSSDRKKLYLVIDYLY